MKRLQIIKDGVVINTVMMEEGLIYVYFEQAGPGFTYDAETGEFSPPVSAQNQNEG